MDDSSPPAKRRNAPQTKARILAAAQQAFAESGYSGAGIREIAAIAGISSPLLLRYFGSKAGLYEAALVDALQIERLLEGPREEFGLRFASVLADPGLDIKAPAMVAPATADADAREITTRAVARYVLDPLVEWLGPPDARVRAMAIMTVGGGYVLYGQQLPIMPLDDELRSQLSDWLARAVQAIVDCA